MNREVIVFGLFKTKEQKFLEKLERIMMTMEAAARADKLDVLWYATREQIKMLRNLHDIGVSQLNADNFLRSRNLVKSLSDEKMHRFMSQKVYESELIFGIASPDGF